MVARKLTHALHAARKQAAPQEEKLQQAFRTEIIRFGRAAARRYVELAGITAAAHWHPPSVADVLALSVRNSRIMGAQRQMLQAVGDVVGGIEGVDFTLTHPITQRILDTLGRRVAGTITAAAREPVAHAISTAFAEGATVPETAAAIRAAVSGVAVWQSVMLARTDLIGMSNGAGQWAVSQLNDASAQAGEPTPVETKTWLSSQDERVRDTHAEADGQTVPIDDVFQVGEATLQYPGDPDGPDDEVINCRCVLLYNEDSGDGGAAPDQAASDAEAVAAGGFLTVEMGVTRRLNLAAASATLRAAVPFKNPAEEERMTTIEAELAVADGTTTRQRWGGDIAFEGVSTGDGRYMVDGSLSWREPPLTLMAQVQTPDFGGHAGAEVAGRMDTFAKNQADMAGKKLPAGVTAIYSEGVFDTGEHGQDIERLVGDETLRGVSVDLAIDEWGFRDAETGEMFVPDEMTPEEWDRAFMGELEFAVIGGTIMATTVCPTPAFADARISLLASAVLRPNVWRAGDEFAAAHGIERGTLMTTLTASLQPVGDDSLVAAGGPRGIAPLAPPVEWFTRQEPGEPTPLTITDAGEIFGHIALWNTCHTGYINGEWSQCVRPPRSQTGYARFHVGEIVTAEGEHLPIGKLTIGTGHAPMTASPKGVRDHYDNTGHVGAFVRATDGKHGVFVSGATRSDMTGEQLRDLRANPPSGDWRAVDHNLELHAALAVPVPGFPVQRSQIALAASGAGGELEVVALILTASIEPDEQQDTTVTVGAEVLAALIDGGTEGLDALIQA